jgi:hypothetical protein
MNVRAVLMGRCCWELPPQLCRSLLTGASARCALQDLPFGVFRLILEHSGFSPYSTILEIRSAVVEC